MQDKKYKVKLHCLYCNSVLNKLFESYEPKLNDMIECDNCGRLNHYESLLKPNTQKWINENSDMITKEIKDIFNSKLKNFNKKLKINL